MQQATPTSGPLRSPVVLTVAGSDSSGGAGIQADLKTFEAHNVFGTSAITAITAQNTLGVTAVLALTPELVEAQVDAVFTDDFPVAAIKIGMLANAGIIQAVARVLQRYAQRLPVVLDPVMVASSGAVLLDPDAIHALIHDLLPLATVLTPNGPEATHLTGLAVTDVPSAIAAANQLARLAPNAWILVKGGHWEAKDQAVDVLVHDGQHQTFTLPWLPGTNNHGTGCTLSSAIAAQLAWGKSVPEAVRLAKQYVHLAMRAAPGYGRGHGPLRHHVEVPT